MCPKSAKFVRFAICKVWCIRTTKTDVCRLCVALAWKRGRWTETNTNTSGNQGLSSHSEETKKGKVVVILKKKKKKLSKSNNVHVQTKCFFSST
jgi:hypothetical protein